MGLLRHVATGRTCTLASRSLLGRSAACAIRSDDARVSSEHAVIAWSGAGWTVRDLGSRNRTAVDDQPLAAGHEARLVLGSRLRFGGDAWVLADDGPPVPQAEDLDEGRRITASGSVLLLPDPEAPLASVVPASDGTWRLEDDADGRLVADLDVVEVGGVAFRLFLPTVTAPTVPADDTTALRFRVSRDEEHVEVSVHGGGRTTRLRPRAHHYLLLTLARRRAGDHALPADDRGWLGREDLARALRIDPVTVNVQLHRIRNDLGQHGEAAAALVEIRPRSGQVRVGTDAIAIDVSP